MKKIGPLSADLVVACKIFEIQKSGEVAEFANIVKGLEGIVTKSTVLTALNTLSNWGIISSEFGETKKGRAGRNYSISGETYAMVRETYEQYWKKVLEAKKPEE